MSKKIRKKVRENAKTAEAKKAIHTLGAILITKAEIPCEKFSSGSDGTFLVLDIDGWLHYADLKLACDDPEHVAAEMKTKWDECLEFRL